MGTSTDAMLLYGYDLGGDEEWKLEGADEYGDYDFTRHDWWEEAGDLIELVEARLLTAHGFTETDKKAAGYWQRWREAKDAMGVELAFHCSDRSPMYVLAAANITASRGYPETVDPAGLDRQVTEGGLNDKLRAALAALGLNPAQDRPRWILCSYWSG